VYCGKTDALGFNQAPEGLQFLLFVVHALGGEAVAGTCGLAGLTKQR